ncbi:hypothetical protein SUGI_0785060 [Cryptomeria japonica]|uniref:conserved oligomeric Golgi complex subunit 4 isoform X2 n=1 Tax=Cryptomeria japonica TaxID=3369 RepID=UPI0024148F80|nr:conserved oligomeric Golgi complex subunit 4 isoform X2 [Cryptomeria japonica]GLJ38521.1 hypothetical protein SUGI_0785060 [Cryptomeria japonica]
MGMAYAGLDNEQEKGGAMLIDFGAPDTVEQIKNLTDVSAMKRFLHECIAYQRNIDAELETLLSQRHELEKKLSGLQKSSEVLEIVKSDSDQMLLSVCSTCDLADHVSGKVRELDLAQSRVQSTLTRIDDIVERGNCIDGAKQALESEDYEGAAKYVETFMKLDDKYGDSNVMGSGGRETATEQTNQLLESKQKLESIVKKKISSAIEERDHPSILRFIKLFPALGLEEEGLQLYVSYLRKDVALRSRLEFEGLMEMAEQSMGQAGAQTQADFVGCLTNLFKDIVLAIEGNDEILRSLCGEDGIVHAIWELQEECNSRGSVILKKYMDYRKLARLASEINSQNNSLISVVGAQEGPDPREIEMYLEEILSLTQLSEDYTQFMMTKLREVGSVDAQLSPRATNTFRSGAFSRAAKELTGYYIILEEFFMVENVRKAIKIDEFIPDGLTTSMVDDVFYVLQSCCRRATSTSSVQSVLAVFNGAINVLNNEFTEALQRKTREPNLGSKLFLGGVGVSKIGTEIATALNNLDVSSEYVLKLRHEIEEYCAEAFPAPADREKVKSCLSELAETNNAFKQVLNAGLEQLASSITPRLRPILDTAATISYELSEMQYAENEINDPWVQKILHAVELNVTWLQTAMTTNNYDSLVHLIIDFIVKRLEVIMTQKRFNQLGGLQLDRDARTLVGHFSSMTQRTVRDKFARLTQMATILNLEKVSEILDYWGENSGPMTWRLTPAEVRRILSLRVDFKPEAIAALKL